MPLEAKVTNVTTEVGKTSKTIKLKSLTGEPNHLRVLGQRVTVTSTNKDVSFVVGPDVKKAHTYTIKAGENPPEVTVVGEEGATFALIYKGSCLYKHA